MSVVNCKVKFIRPRYQNLKEWMTNNNNIYIGRAGVVIIQNNDTNKKERFPKEESIFANPYKIGKDGTRDAVIQKYKKYIIDKLETSITFQNEFKKLKGKNLGCWCYPEPCHGDILQELLKKNINFSEYFNGICADCDIKCNERNSWQCMFCKNIYCNAHNTEGNTCSCYKNYINNINYCDFCEKNSFNKLYKCSNCNDYQLCEKCLLGDDIIPEGLLYSDSFACCDNPSYNY